MPGVGDGTFGAAQVVTEGLAANGELGISVTIADVDGDGAQDVLAAYYAYDAVTNGSNEGAIWVGYGDGGGGSPRSSCWWGSREPARPSRSRRGRQRHGLRDVIRGSWTFTNGQYYEGATLIHLATEREFNDPVRAVETNPESSGADAGLGCGLRQRRAERARGGLAGLRHRRERRRRGLHLLRVRRSPSRGRPSELGRGTARWCARWRRSTWGRGRARTRGRRRSAPRRARWAPSPLPSSHPGSAADGQHGARIAG